jgi:5-methylcytosine-specific restriction endonuclease McrA
MQIVFVVDKNRQPLMPCHPARARKLLTAGKAAVLRRFPFTIRLLERAGGAVQPVQFKIDPGSKQTGLALVAAGKRGKRVVWAATLAHRGPAIKTALAERRSHRRSRRQRHTRYRKARFDNRRRSDGWLPPSLQSRVENVWTWLCRIQRVCPLASISQELVRFDTQLMQNAEISGVEYQRGVLAGYEVREYLLEKWGRKCAYCGVKAMPLEIEHLTPRSRGGSNRVSNLTLACHACNQRKGNKTAAEFGYPTLQKQASQPLKDAAAINATRWALYQRLQKTELPVEVGTGGRTKYNRVCQSYPKAHWIDAACVGASGACVQLDAQHIPLHFKATGHGRRQRCRPDAFGFPKGHAPRAKSFWGFQTGDMVTAVVPTGKYAGKRVGRIAIRFRPSFQLNGVDVHPKYLTLIHRADGYEYTKGSLGWIGQGDFQHEVRSTSPCPIPTGLKPAVPAE